MKSVKQKLVAWLCVLAMVCTMLPMTTVKANAAVASDSEYIYVNEDVNDQLDTAEDVNWYCFDISEEGYFNLVFYYTGDDCELGWKMTLYNDRGVEIKSHVVEDTFRSCEYPLGAGTYYIKVQACDDSDWYAPIEVPYTLIVEFYEDETWEVEDNDSYNNATTLELNQLYSGILYDDEDVDFYQFDVVEDGYFYLDFGPKYMGEDNINYGWKVTYYDSNKKEIGYHTTEEFSETIKYAFKQGTYYVKVEAAITGWGFEPDECPYEIYVNFEESSRWESEYNDTKKTADPIKLNTSYNYKGSLTDYDTKDYFKFTLPAKGKVKISLTPGDYIEYYDDGWKVSLVNANTGTKVLFTNVLTNKAKTMILAKGTYYVLIEGYYDEPVGAEYGLKVKYSRNPAKPVISKVTTKNKTATVKWKKASYATGYYIYRSTSGKAGTFKKIATTKKLTYTNKNLKKGKRYYYKVKAYRTYNGVTSVSDISKYKSVKVK